MSSSQPASPPEWARDVALTIVEQLGGVESLRLMLGASIQLELDYDPALGAGLLVTGIDMTEVGGRATAFRVRLAPSDTYDVEVFEGAKGNLALIDSVDDIYSDMLIECVERRTGYSLTSPFRPSGARRMQAHAP